MARSIITAEEMALARLCVDIALDCGASQVRSSLSKTAQSTIGVLDGELDKLNYSIDRSIYLNIYAGGKAGTFSTNRLDSKGLTEFVREAVQTTGILAPEPCYTLPHKDRKATGCTSGDELGLSDDSWFDISQDERVALALSCNHGGILSEEGEYSDSFDDNYMVDSEGFEGRHFETSFSYCSNVTVEHKGDRFSGYCFHNRLKRNEFDPSGVSAEAIRLARSKAGARSIASGRCKVVIDRLCASRLISPIVSAMSAWQVYQHNSFLDGKLGSQIFNKYLNISDMARARGKCGSRMFDTEGVATSDSPLIREGVLDRYFVSTFMANKTGMAPTVEACSRICLEPWICNSDKKEISLDDILYHLGDAVYVTGFNGGNCNGATGDFSFGIEGFLVRGGRIAHPVKELVMTGNIIQMWNSLLAVGSDPVEGLSWQIPTLAFDNVEIDN